MASVLRTLHIYNTVQHRAKTRCRTDYSTTLASTVRWRCHITGARLTLEHGNTSQGCALFTATRTSNFMHFVPMRTSNPTQLVHTSEPQTSRSWYLIRCLKRHTVRIKFGTSESHSSYLIRSLKPHTVRT